MTRIAFEVETGLTPAAVLAVLTDFGPGRAEAWPNIDGKYFKIHDRGPDWAEVTEGSSVAGGVWERERYGWDPEGLTVLVDTLDSNTWGLGSRWKYRISATAAGGSRVAVEVVRNPKGWKGRLIALGLAVAGARTLSSQLAGVLARAER